jgi:hypothetical protein
MTSPRSWIAYPLSYRAKEMTILASWVQSGESGSLIGLAGAGKSNLLGFTCNRPEVLRSYLPDGIPPIAVVWVDLTNLPAVGAVDVETNLYRVVLRALYEARAQLSSVERSLAESVETVYRRVEDRTDPFLTQSALREALFLFQDKGTRLVLVLDPFEPFCRTAPICVLDSIRGLRDSFKTTLSYIIGLRQELAAVRDPMEMGELFEILDTHRCWVGAMETEDARWVIRQVEQTTGQRFAQADVERLIELSGGYPSVLRATSIWLAGSAASPMDEGWTERLLAERSIQYRFEEIWDGLSGEEQRAVTTLHRLQSPIAARETGCEPATDAETPEADHLSLDKQIRGALDHLTALGICGRDGCGYRIRSPLLACYVGSAREEGDDTVWLDKATGELYLGQTPLTGLAPLERELLRFFVEHPLVRHTKTDLILNAWPEDPCPLERSDDSVYQVIRGLRTKIEPSSSKPRYIITWRGSGAQEGGYQFYPKGR